MRPSIFKHRTVISLLIVFASWTASFAAPFPGVPAPPRLNASSFILVDFDTGSVLAEHNANERVEPASLTKIMTSYVAAEALASGAIAIDDTTTVSEKAWRMGGSKMFIEVNKQVTVDELLQGIVYITFCPLLQQMRKPTKPRAVLLRSGMRARQIPARLPPDVVGRADC